MKTVLFCVSVLVLQCVAFGQQTRTILHREDLEPVPSALTYHTPEYHQSLRQVLFGKAPRRSDVQFLILPSFEPETLVSIYDVDNGFEVQIVRAEKQIWNEGNSRNVAGEIVGDGGVRIQIVTPDQQRSWDEEKAGEVPCKVMKKALPASVYVRLKALWKSMLLRTQHQRNDRQVIDGVSYVFVSYERGIGWRSGRAHSPAEGTRPFMLAEIGKLVVAFVEAESSAEEETLSRMTELMDNLESMLARAR